MEEKVNYDKLREMIARCEWTFAKSMPFAPHEYIECTAEPPLLCTLLNDLSAVY